MSKGTFDFDEQIDRKNTNSLKYDFAVHRGKPADILPLWVADMDFKVAGPILDAIIKRTQHGIFGYSEVQEDYFEAVKNWMEKKHDWTVERKWLVKTPGVVFALAMAVKAFTEPGDGVMIQQPVYYPFSEVIKDNDRKIVDNTLVLGADGVYRMDLEDFEKKAAGGQVKLFLLCNPHNPVGRVFHREELEKVGEICNRHNIIVVSDEIHQDFVYNGKHQVFANLTEELKNRTITCTAPSKTFNVAGLQVSNIFIPNTELRRKFKKQMAAAGYSQLNTLGLTACEAAYRYGEAWHQELIEYLKENLTFVRKYLEENLPEIRLIEPEGTYLVWLDFRKLSLTEEEREDLIVNKAGLWLDSGAIFGEAGEGFERVNIACPRSTLQLAFDKLRVAIADLKKI
ncbi:MalY/PatB family protein [Lacrimispora sp. JR3]|uniref:MalY/PatB family protein n=1 Tax=Lacrimispora sinapis TaxID=3111456 RepID=UPI00374A6E26